VRDLATSDGAREPATKAVGAPRILPGWSCWPEWWSGRWWRLSIRPLRCERRTGTICGCCCAGLRLGTGCAADSWLFRGFFGGWNGEAVARPSHKKDKVVSSTREDMIMDSFRLPPSDKNKDVRWMGHSFIPCGPATPWTTIHRCKDVARMGQPVARSLFETRLRRWMRARIPSTWAWTAVRVTLKGAS